MSMRVRNAEGEAGPRRSLRAVWWKAGGLVEQIAAGMRMDVAIEPKINAWQGRVNVEGEIRDVVVR